MRQKFEEILDGLITAHRIETPNQKNTIWKTEKTGKALVLATCVALIALAGAVARQASIIAINSEVNGKQLPIYCIKTEEPKVSLTFDVAWGNEDIGKILEILEKHQIRVTFFMTGNWVDAYAEDVKAILAAGHDLGNHGDTHKNMSQLPDSEKREELTKVHNKVKELTGYTMFLFRPPYGDYDDAVIRTAYGSGYYPVLWDVDSLDWKDYGVDAISKAVLDNQHLGNGSIILCHAGTKYTSLALDGLITALKDRGVELVPVSELIYYDDYDMDHEGRQIKSANSQSVWKRVE